MEWLEWDKRPEQTGYSGTDEQNGLVRRGKVTGNQ